MKFTIALNKRLIEYFLWILQTPVKFHLEILTLIKLFLIAVLILFCLRYDTIGKHYRGKTVIQKLLGTILHSIDLLNFSRQTITIVETGDATLNFTNLQRYFWR